MYLVGRSDAEILVHEREITYLQLCWLLFITLQVPALNDVFYVKSTNTKTCPVTNPIYHL